MPSDYVNDQLLDTAERYDATVEPGAYIPRKDEDGEIENWLNEIQAAQDGIELHLSDLARDKEQRLGWIINSDANGLDVIASVGFLDDLDDHGYEDASFDDSDELQQYIADVARYGGLGQDAYSSIEPAVIEEDETLDEAVRSYIEEAGYTGITVEGTPEHAVEQAMELLTLPADQRTALQDATYGVTIAADETVAARLED